MPGLIAVAFFSLELLSPAAHSKYKVDVLSTSQGETDFPIANISKNAFAIGTRIFCTIWVNIIPTQLSIETVTSALYAMIQLANQSAVFWRLWEIKHFSYYYSSKLRHFGWWRKFEALCCNELNITDYLIGSSILKYCFVPILWRLINFARYQILIKRLPILWWIFRIS